jgi:hypothetical protein
MPEERGTFSESDQQIRVVFVFTLGNADFSHESIFQDCNELFSILNALSDSQKKWRYLKPRQPVLVGQRFARPRFEDSKIDPLFVGLHLGLTQDIKLRGSYEQSR